LGAFLSEVVMATKAHTTSAGERKSLGHHWSDPALVQESGSRKTTHSLSES